MFLSFSFAEVSLACTIETLGGEILGRVSGSIVMDKNWEELGSLTGSTIYDEYGRPLGEIEASGKVRDFSEGPVGYASFNGSLYGVNGEGLLGIGSGCTHEQAGVGGYFLVF